jgi:hypothetical protein
MPTAETPAPAEFVSVPVRVTAMQWNPADILAAGVMVGWLMRHDVPFTHPSGSGATTTLHLAGDFKPLQPGGWVVAAPKNGKTIWSTLTNREFKDHFARPGEIRG